MQTLGASAAGSVSTSSISLPQSAGTATYSANTRSLIINDLNLPLTCPEGLRVSWSSAASSPVTTAGK